MVICYYIKGTGNSRGGMGERANKGGMDDCVDREVWMGRCMVYTILYIFYSREGRQR